MYDYKAKRTRDGGSLQEPTPIRTDNEADLVFFTDAKATEQGAWIGGFLQSKEGSIIFVVLRRGARKLGTVAFCS